MFKSYLPLTPLIILIVVSLFCLPFGFIYLLFFLGVAVVYFAIFRLFKKELKGTFSLENEQDIISPIVGTLTNVQEVNGDQVLRFKMGILGTYGIYFPSKSEIFDIFYKKNCEVIFKNSSFSKIKLIFCSNIFNLYPKLFVVSGDKGKVCATLGFFPFGGTVLLYLSEKYEIMVSVGDKISIGKVLAKKVIS